MQKTLFIVLFSLLLFQKVVAQEALKVSVTCIEDTLGGNIWIGAKNPIRIEAGGIENADLEVKIHGSNATIKRQNDIFFIHTSSLGVVELSIFDKRNGQQKFLKNHIFQSKRVPEPVVLLGKRHNNREISKGEFLLQFGLGVVLPDCSLQHDCKVIEFQVVIVARDQEAITFQNKGERFSAEIKNAFQKMPLNSTVYFEEINATCAFESCTNNRLAKGITFKIK